jgi:hypothetical protein
MTIEAIAIRATFSGGAKTLLFCHALPMPLFMVLTSSAKWEILVGRQPVRLSTGSAHSDIMD